MRQSQHPKWIIYTILFGLLSPFLIAQTVPVSGIESITPQEMKDHVFFLASDLMRGRNTPSPELDSCASYIAKQFQSYGLKSIDGDSFFQTFYVERAHLAEPNTLSILSDGEEEAYEIKRDFVPLFLSASQTITSIPIVFAGWVSWVSIAIRWSVGQETACHLDDDRNAIESLWQTTYS